jgi:hypothetical protein
MDNGRFSEAKVAFTESYRLAPQNPLGRAEIASAAAGGRPLYAPVRRTVRGRGLVGVPSAYPGSMADVERINAINRANIQRMMPPQPGVPQPPYGPANPYGPQQPRQPGMP